jgi:hypothetical protein
MLTRRILIACVGLGLGGACHPGAPSAPATPPVTTPTPPATGGGLTADGRHFATERVYQGECAPAGSRGGCHTITLRPAGTYRNFLFDAAIDGTYEIRGDVVTLRGSDASMPAEQLTLSADRTRLGDLTLQPTPTP